MTDQFEGKNLDSNKKKVGKPLKFETPEALLEAINGYFETTNPEEYSVTGLALIIGSRQLLDDYQKRDAYKWIVEQAKLIVENAYELSLRKKGRTGDIFALKNFGWKDTVVQDNTGNPTQVIYIDPSEKKDLEEHISDVVDGNKES